MANPEHVEMLLRGVEAWNKWRASNKRALIDLSHANLKGGSLSGADLTSANLTGAKLYKADLSHADLSVATLWGAMLAEANLRNAILISTSMDGAELIKVNLTGADLRGARLYNAKLFNTQLTGANFQGAEMVYTNISDVDLSQVKNLDLVIHRGPSNVSIGTVYLSQGNIPEKFLRGCGVPEDFVTYMRSLTAKPIEFYSCFISYSDKDEEFAKRLYNDLQSEGVRCWFAPEDLKIGEKFRVRIDESIRLYDKLVLVLSENSVSSEWVGDEVEAALEKEAGQEGKVVLFPLRLDEAVMEIQAGWPAKIRRTRHIGDFRDWKSHDSYRKAFERLMRDLKAGAGG